MYIEVYIIAFSCFSQMVLVLLEPNTSCTWLIYACI